MRVVVVGGGASGTLAALHLARSGAGRPLELHLAEPGPLGRGVAYSTGNHQHRLNVPAAGMSALPGEPGHFVDWLRAHHDPAFPAGGPVPKAVPRQTRSRQPPVVQARTLPAPMEQARHVRPRPGTETAPAALPVAGAIAARRRRQPAPRRWKARATARGGRRLERLQSGAPK